MMGFYPTLVEGSLDFSPFPPFRHSGEGRNPE